MYVYEMCSTEEFSKVLQRKQASFLSITDLIVEYFGEGLEYEEMPTSVIQSQHAILRIRKEKKYRLRTGDFQVYRQAVMDYTSMGFTGEYNSSPRPTTHQHIPRDKQQLLLSLTPAGTDDEMSLNSTPCGSTRSVRCQSYSSTVNRKASVHYTETSKGLQRTKSPGFTASQPTSPRRRTKARTSTPDPLAPPNNLVVMSHQESPLPGSPRRLLRYESQHRSGLTTDEDTHSESSAISFFTGCILAAKNSPLFHRRKSKKNYNSGQRNGMWSSTQSEPSHSEPAMQCSGNCSSILSFEESSKRKAYTESQSYSSEEDSFHLHAKSNLNNKINTLFGKIGSSAFELLDDHKSSLGDCVANEYMLASLFEHKSGSMFFYGMVDTIFWHGISRTVSFVQFQTTSRTAPSPHHLMQLHCFQEIAVKKKLCRRIKLYVLGLHLEADGPRLKLWRYKPSSGMPGLKSLLFDPKNLTREKLLSCPEFSFLVKNQDVLYEVV